jgi:hypothetical protein
MFEDRVVTYHHIINGGDILCTRLPGGTGVHVDIHLYSDVYASEDLVPYLEALQAHMDSFKPHLEG